MKLSSVALPSGTPQVMRGSGGYLSDKLYDLTYDTQRQLINVRERSTGATQLIHPAGCVMVPVDDIPRKPTK